MPSAAVATIDLAAPRVFAFTEGKRNFTFTCKPITKPMWIAYFAGIVSTDQRVDDGIESTYDSAGSRLDLLDAALIDATGYTRDGVSITEVEDWQRKLPMRHRIAVSNLLAAVRLEAADDSAYDLGYESVTLAATWTANAEGRMQEITGLRHTFSSPTADHQKRYSRAMSRSVIVGDSRTAQTRYLGAQDVLIEIYDELIQRVEGYNVGGSQLTEMDCYHKVVAAGALFTPVVIA